MDYISHSAESAIDDMARDMSSVDTHSIVRTEEPHIRLIAFENWEALAYDLALGVASDQELANGYGVELEALYSTLQNPNFKKMLEVKKKEVDGLGNGADFTVKMRLIANKAAPKLLKRLLSGGTEDKDFVKLFETATRLGQLEPSKDEEVDDRGLVGAGITINLHGMPGLDHLTVGSAEPKVAKEKEDIEYAEVVQDQPDDSEDLLWL